MDRAIKGMIPFTVPTLLTRKLRLGEVKDLRAHREQVGKAGN